MILRDVLLHSFSEEELNQGIESYSVRNTLNLEEYEIISNDKEIIAKIVKNKEKK